MVIPLITMVMVTITMVINGITITSNDDDGDVSDTLRHRDEARDEGHLE